MTYLTISILSMLAGSAIGIWASWGDIEFYWLKRDARTEE